MEKQGIIVVSTRDKEECERRGVVGVFTMWGEDIEDLWDGMNSLLWRDEVNEGRLPYVIQTGVKGVEGFDREKEMMEDGMERGGVSMLYEVYGILFRGEEEKRGWERDNWVVMKYVSLE